MAYSYGAGGHYGVNGGLIGYGYSYTALASSLDPELLHHHQQLLHQSNNNRSGSRHRRSHTVPCATRSGVPRAARLQRRPSHPPMQRKDNNHQHDTAPRPLSSLTTYTSLPSGLTLRRGVAAAAAAAAANTPAETHHPSRPRRRQTARSHEIGPGAAAAAPRRDHAHGGRGRSRTEGRSEEDGWRRQRRRQQGSEASRTDGRRRSDAAAEEMGEQAKTPAKKGFGMLWSCFGP